MMCVLKMGAGDGFREGIAQMGQLQTKQLENQHGEQKHCQDLDSLSTNTRFLSA